MGYVYSRQMRDGDRRYAISYDGVDGRECRRLVRARNRAEALTLLAKAEKDVLRQLRERAAQPSNLLPVNLAELEKLTISEVLAGCDGNRSRAARLLGIHRRTIIRKIKLYGLN